MFDMFVTVVLTQSSPYILHIFGITKKGLLKKKTSCKAKKMELNGVMMLSRFKRICVFVGVVKARKAATKMLQLSLKKNWCFRKLQMKKSKLQVHLKLQMKKG
ncbi:hypothetical protein Hanom_Chr14g01251971 [Helianthus anomalus]